MIFAAKRLRPLRVLAFATLVLATARAQTPTRIELHRLRDYRQLSAAEHTFTSATASLAITFDRAPDSAASVQVRTSEGTTLTLTRDVAGVYRAEQTFETAAALDARFPDGLYALTIGSAAPINFAVLLVEPVEPVRIANFDALQNWPNASPTIQWPEIRRPAGGSVAASLTISRSDGTTVFTTPSSFAADTTSFTVPSVPLFTPLLGKLAFTRATLAVVNNAATTLVTGRGFTLTFPLQCAVDAPTFIAHPESQVTTPGEEARFSFGVTGASPMTIQWLKDGRAIPGATSSGYTVRNVQVADAGRYTVEATNAAGRAVSEPALLAVPPAIKLSHIAGAPERQGSADGPGDVARFTGPHTVVVDRAGNIFVTDLANHTIRKISPAGVVSTFAGTAGAAGSTDNVGAAARFTYPSDMAIDANDNLYVLEGQGTRVRRISSSGVVTTLAGSLSDAGSADGPAAVARFRFASGIAVDAEGTVYIADTGNHTIRRIRNGNVDTWLGRVGVSGTADGPAADVRLNAPLALAFDRDGVLFVSDAGSKTIRKVARNGDTRTWRSTGDYAVTALAIDPAGYVFIVINDSALHRLTPDGAPRGAVVGNIIADLTGYFGYPSATSVAIARDGTLVTTTYSMVLKGVVQPGSSDSGITVLSPPQTHVVKAGDQVMLAFSAAGPGLAYQWRRDGIALLDAQSNTLRIPAASAADAGRYSVMAYNTVGSVIADFGSLALAAPGAEPGRLVNLSIRARVGGGAGSLTLGAVVGRGDSGATPPQLLVRAIGPSLAPFGVAAPLSDPVLTLYRATQGFAANDDWNGTAALQSAFPRVGAFALDAASRDAATLNASPAGNYDVVVSGKGASTGVALAEIYDASPNGAAPGGRLVNLSARTQVGVGADILIAGFGISGGTSRTLLIRAIGPSLAKFGVGGLYYPELKLFAGNALLATNIGWDRTPVLREAARSVGAFDIDEHNDCVLLVTLPPGAYSAQISGRSATTGVGLVEIYELP